MPADKRKTALKTVLLAPAAPIEVWAIQQLAAGQTVTGGVALVLGMAMVAAYVVIQEVDHPYVDEVLDIVADGVTDDTEGVIEEEVKEVAKQAGDAAEDATNGGSGG